MKDLMFFERKLQASTMRILDTYFKPGTPTSVAIPISEGCRKSTLTFRASSAFIFDRARDEMLENMGIEKIPRVSLVINGGGVTLRGISPLARACLLHTTRNIPKP